MDDCCCKRLVELEKLYGEISVFVCNHCKKTFMKNAGENKWAELN